MDGSYKLLVGTELKIVMEGKILEGERECATTAC